MIWKLCKKLFAFVYLIHFVKSCFYIMVVLLFGVYIFNHVHHLIMIIIIAAGAFTFNCTVAKSVGAFKIYSFTYDILKCFQFG